MKKLLWHFGPKRGGVRVFDDPAGGRVLVLWRRHGARKQESYPRTANGRLEAKSFAEGIVASGAPVPAPDLTVRGLWLKYLEANAHALRKKSLITNGGRWRKFEVFAGHDRPAASVTLEELDTYAKQLRERHVPNQVALHLQMVRLVFRWARTRGLLISSVPEYRYRLGRDDRKLEPAEYGRAEFERILAALDPRSSRQWRAWVVLMLVGHQVPRINAALRLKVTDVVGDSLRWDADSDKMGRERLQPLTWGGLSAVLTALWWRAKDGYTGPWLIYRARGASDEPYTVQSAYYHLREAERRAKVPHLERRAFHGGRKMGTGDIAAETGDAWLALQFAGDTDPRRAREYVKDREDRMRRAAAAMDTRSGAEGPVSDGNAATTEALESGSGTSQVGES